MIDPSMAAGLLSNLGSASGGGGGGGGAGGAAGGAGAIMGLASSLIQGIQAKRLKNKSDAAMPELVDPNQAAFLAELNQKRRSIETGADFAGAMANIDATTAGTQEAITRATGGDVGGTIQALLQAQRTAGGAKNQAIAQGQQQQQAYTGMYKQMLDQIAGRRFSLQQQRSQQALAEWGKMKQGANQNFMAGLAGAAGMLSQIKPGEMGGEMQPEAMEGIDPGLLPTGGDGGGLMGDAAGLDVDLGV